MIIGVIIFLIIVGVVLWLLQGKIHPTLMTLIIVLIVLAVCLWMLAAFNIITLPAAFQLKGAH